MRISSTIHYWIRKADNNRTFLGELIANKQNDLLMEFRIKEAYGPGIYIITPISFIDDEVIELIDKEVCMIVHDFVKI